ncbi:riboflavin synthase [Sesbania bispinosa]|nr:riboflavin synthase [Sesbania bispinosa]
MKNKAPEKRLDEQDRTDIGTLKVHPRVNTRQAEQFREEIIYPESDHWKHESEMDKGGDFEDRRCW